MINKITPIFKRKYLELKNDFENFEWNNNNETKVINSNYFSSYKGCIVIRTNMKRSGSFGILFISRKSNKFKVPEDVVRHEYGHALQLKKMGVIKYTIFIGIPSLLNLGKGKYYDKPWEITADILGEVCSRKHKDSDIIKGNIYMKKWS